MVEDELRLRSSLGPSEAGLEVRVQMSVSELCWAMERDLLTLSEPLCELCHGRTFPGWDVGGGDGPWAEA